MPNYKNTLREIEAEMDSYRTVINNLAADYTGAVNRVESDLQRLKGSLTEQGESAYRQAHYPDKTVFSRRISAAQEKTRTVTEHHLNRLKKEIDAYFEHPVRAEFSTRITAIITIGMKLSRHEFDSLCNAAEGYNESRLVQAAGEKAGYEFRLPDADAVYKAADRLKTSVNGTLKYYSGKNSELIDLMPGVEHGIMYSALGDAFYRTKPAAEAEKALDAAYALMPQKEAKTALSESDKRLIDAIIAPDSLQRYPFATEERVKQLCKEDPQLKELFSLDSRYAKFTTEED